MRPIDSALRQVESGTQFGDVTRKMEIGEATLQSYGPVGIQILT